MGAASRPGQALRYAGVLLATAIVMRVPTIRAEFAATIAAAAAGTEKRHAGHVLAENVRAEPLPRFAAVGRYLPGIAPPHVRLSARTLTPPIALIDFVTPIAPVAAAAVEQGEPPDIGRGTSTWEAAGVGIAPGGDGGTLAQAAYARLAAGDRRGAVRLFDRALTFDDPRGAAWSADRDRITRKWSGSAYSIIRAAGDATGIAAPILGGGQSGASLRFTPDPLARRPIALVARVGIGHDDPRRSKFVAAGVQLRPVAGVSLAVERIEGIGPSVRSGWSLRAAAGFERAIGGVRASGYSEGGLIGEVPYVAGQIRAAVGLHRGDVQIEPGLGCWAGLQHDGHSASRVDVGPGVLARSGALAIEADYRVRVAGNAMPGSGPVVTVSAAF